MASDNNVPGIVHRTTMRESGGTGAHRRTGSINSAYDFDVAAPSASTSYVSLHSSSSRSLTTLIGTTSTTLGDGTGDAERSAIAVAVKKPTPALMFEVSVSATFIKPIRPVIVLFEDR
tara:strand:+ start:424 stop:777 length:354 start_codon:yes stop_codon:yes gene_type:complete